MPLDETKFIKTNGSPSGGTQPTESSIYGESDIPRFSGQVKLNGSNSVKPQFTLSTNTEYKLVEYNGATLADLSSSPTTLWPSNVTTPAISDMYLDSSDTFVENQKEGQISFWRIIYSFTGKPTTADEYIHVIMRNPLTSFEVGQLTTFGDGITDKSNIIVTLQTISDAASLPAPLGTGQGYEIFFLSAHALTITVESISRISLGVGV